MVLPKNLRLKIYSTKTKCMRLCGNNLPRVTIILDDIIMDQLSEFKYILDTLSTNTKEMWK